MAQIRVQPKILFWPWILLGVGLLAIIIYFLFAFTQTRDRSSMENVVGAEVINNNKYTSTIDEYVRFVNNDKNKISLDPTCTRAALLKLARAIGAVAKENGYTVPEDLSKAEEYANRITENSLETTNADNIGKAADILSTSLYNLQETKYPALATEARDLRTMDTSIKSTRSMLKQKEIVKYFFRQAAKLLENMNS